MLLTVCKHKHFWQGNHIISLIAV